MSKPWKVSPSIGENRTNLLAKTNLLVQTTEMVQQLKEGAALTSSIKVDEFVSMSSSLPIREKI